MIEQTAPACSAAVKQAMNVTGLPDLAVRRKCRLIPFFAWVFYAAIGASASYALSGRFAFAVGTAAIALVAVALRRGVIPAMELIGGQIEADGASAIARFRKVHSVALLTNLVQLVVIVWGLIQMSL